MLRRRSHLYSLILLPLILELVFGLQQARADNIVGDVGIGVTESSSNSLVGALASASVEPSSGVLRGSLPLQYPAARGGAQPGLSLDYSSASGIREAGVGWGLNLPVIERKNLSGPPRYDQPSPWFPTAGDPFNDRFVFGGAPLVPICTITGSTCAGQTEPMPDWIVPDAVYYRLENDTLGARFFLWPDHMSWRIQLRGGELLELGRPLIPPYTDAWDDVDGIDFDTHFTVVRNNDGFYQSTSPGADGIPVANTARSPYRWNVVRRYDPPSSGGPRNLVVYSWTKRDASGRGYLTDVYYTPPKEEARASLASFAHHLRLVWTGTEPPLILLSGPAAPIWKATPELALARVDVASKRWGTPEAPRELVRRYHLTYRQSLLPSRQLVEIAGTGDRSFGRRYLEVLPGRGSLRHRSGRVI